MIAVEEADRFVVIHAMDLRPKFRRLYEEGKTMNSRATQKPGKTRNAVNVEYDDATVDRIVSEVEAAIVAGRGTVTYPRKGRPSLTGKPTASPSVGFRITPELRAQAEDVAKRKGVSVSELARKALEEYVRKAG